MADDYLKTANPATGGKLDSMNKWIAQNGGGGNVDRPKLWVGGGQKKVAIPQDASGGGDSYVCSTLRREGVISRKDFIWLTNGHAKAVLTRGDFVAWYAKNMGAIVERADAQGFDWQTMKYLVDRMRLIYVDRGFAGAFTTYLNLCSALYTLYGKYDESIDPFLESFYRPTLWDRVKGTMRVVSGARFWKQIPIFIRTRRMA